MINKVVASAEEAIKDIKNGASIMFGGFGLCGIPEKCIHAIAVSYLKDIICISNDAGEEDFGLGYLIKNRQIKKIYASYIGENPEAERQMLKGELDVELTPQGTLAEKCRAAGAGIPAFYTPAGYGTEVAEGKDIRVFDGKPYIMEYALKADFAIVKAWKGDKYGNLIYKGTAQNFNPVIAMAGKITIAEVEELLEPGEIDYNFVHTPGIFVQRIFQGENYEKRISQLTVKKK